MGGAGWDALDWFACAGSAGWLCWLGWLPREAVPAGLTVFAAHSSLGWRGWTGWISLGCSICLECSGLARLAGWDWLGWLSGLYIWGGCGGRLDCLGRMSCLGWPG